MITLLLTTINWDNLKDSSLELAAILAGFGMLISLGIGASKLMSKWNEEREADKLRKRYMDQD